MKRYRVEGGSAQIGPDETIGLTPEQFAARAHRMTAGEPVRVGGVALIACSPLQPLEFKVGEELFLADVPSKAMAPRLVPVGHEDGRFRPPPEAKADDAEPEPAKRKRRSRAKPKAPPVETKEPGGPPSEPTPPAA